MEYLHREFNRSLLIYGSRSRIQTIRHSGLCRQTKRSGSMTLTSGFSSAHPNEGHFLLPIPPPICSRWQQDQFLLQEDSNTVLELSFRHHNKPTLLNSKEQLTRFRTRSSTSWTRTSNSLWTSKLKRKHNRRGTTTVDQQFWFRSSSSSTTTKHPVASPWRASQRPPKTTSHRGPSKQGRAASNHASCNKKRRYQSTRHQHCTIG